MAQLCARGPGACARRRLGPWDEATGGHAIVDPGDAREGMPLVEQDAPHTRANAGHSVEPGEALRLVRLGCLADRALDGAEPPILVGKEREIAFAPLRHGRRRAPLSNSSAVSWIRHRLPALRQVRLAVGLLDRREQRGTLPREMPAPPPESTRRAPPGRVDIRLWSPAAPPPDGNILGGDLVVCGLAAMERLPREGVAKDQRHPVLRPESSEPIPRDDPFASDAPLVSRGRGGLEQRLWASWHGPVQQALTILMQDAEGHGAGMQVDAAVPWVWRRREAPEVSSSLLSESLPLSADH